ncbi:hypothetical protein F383_30203 [Gossypium arboreum]|uniref:Uncharacterized protein n=1 Tax=Gossypium arboreum TaxID=29729 RepID=A0A0B0PDV7_GOSAR|nr:hypothetical protein F383_30203 [Gossypium arboreum]
MSSMEEGGGPVGAVSIDQTIIDNNDSTRIDIVMDMDDFLSFGELENFRSLDKALDRGQPTLRYIPLIRRVPPTLSRNEDFKMYFNPKVIGIGPLHHNDYALSESEELKLKLAAHFVKKIGVVKETLYINIKKEMDCLKECYDPQELEKYSYNELAWMFFVDGYAILQAVYMRYDDDDDDDDDDDGKLFIKNDLLTFVYSDLFLLENQLPFRVLELLTRSNDGKKFMKAIIRFIDSTVKEPQSHQQDSEWWPQLGGEPIHLLHLLRERLLVKKRKPWRWLWWLFTEVGFSNEATKRHHPHTIGNVKELKNAGI